ncbi:MAG: hypothetical protein QOF76_1306 [Solirubrobacteraceae bacterium]|jgi:hypothetical protein|nr:hypothetical protein [Solirubrobacteraceae bacterium]
MTARPPQGVVYTLTPEQLAHLEGVLKDARRRQASELAASADRALSVIPGLLRRPVKKALGL